MRLEEPLTLGPRRAPNRLMFGPHETNLGRGRSISDRHVAYYRARAEGGAGVIVTEEASVHASDWPYERCPLASECDAGWAAVAQACHPSGALVLAAIGHAGGQGSSAYSQTSLWAPSRVPEVNSREVPKWMEPTDIRAVVVGFEEAAARARAAGLDGVEVNAGQFSLVRQFLSGLTNQRDDGWGTDRLLFARQVLRGVRRAAGPQSVIGLRLSADELAPWAGIVPDAAVGIAQELADLVDYITVVRGAIFTASATRPDGHVAPGFNLGLAARIRAALPPSVAVIAQGSIVDADQAEAAVDRRQCDAVEMTRAQIADPALGRKLRDPVRIRPCILCNQTCQVRDARNPIVSCVGHPDAGHETEPAGPPPNAAARDVLVIGGGVAGLECARVAAGQGHRVHLVEASEELGGMVRIAAAAPGRERLARLVDWLVDECLHAGVTIATGHQASAEDLADHPGPVILCTGSTPGRRTYEAGGPVVTAAEALAGAPLPEGPVAVWDPIGGPIGVSVAEWARAAGRDVSLITPDLIAGNELSRSGDLAPANVRLLSGGVVIEKRSILRRVGAGEVEVEDKFTGERRSIPAAVLIDAGYHLPDDRLWRATGERLPRAGDAVAPRSIYEAILEGRRAALALDRMALV
jgi:mycofactocin system FadH/OYE family oxidoreductase 1